MEKVLNAVKGLMNFWRKSTVLRISVLLLMVGVITITMILSTYSQNVNNGLSDNLIRLHVIANSDSDADQSLKRDVRDAILDYMKVELKDSKDITQTKAIINKDMAKIKEIASGVIKKEGKVYPVNTMMGKYPFPTKVYGDISLPAGTYEALRVVIGKGDGANWWCVLFPPLCFVDATHGVVPDSMKQKLKDVLTDDEYSIVTSADTSEDIPVKIKFKIVEFFQKAKSTITSFINKIF
ncbi:MAG: stage II sporulation protein R [Bacillota bacterium]|nr:stage II sporulation protein R [Bacillota bacterium]